MICEKLISTVYIIVVYKAWSQPQTAHTARLQAFTVQSDAYCTQNTRSSSKLHNPTWRGHIAELDAKLDNICTLNSTETFIS